MSTEMNNLIARFNQLETSFTALKSDLIAYVQGQTSTVGANVPPVTAPPPQYEFDINNMLVHARQYGNGRVDPVVGPDCPHTRVMEKTGHVLSDARPDLGEMFVGYVQRVADQATGGKGDTILGTLGSLFLGTSTYFAKAPGGQFNPDGSNWPEAADCFCNMRAYMTDEEKARDDRMKTEWAAWDQTFKNQQQPPAPPAPPAPPVPPTEPPEEEL